MMIFGFIKVLKPVVAKKVLNDFINISFLCPTIVNVPTASNVCLEAIQRTPTLNSAIPHMLCTAHRSMRGPLVFLFEAGRLEVFRP